MSWIDLPEPILHQIFGYLNKTDIYNASLSCKHWYFASCDNVLWKRLFHRDLKISQTMTIRDENSTWKEEYRNLTDEIPTILSQDLNEHKDEVLHVTFSNDGLEFASCSKDHNLIIWTDQENTDGIFQKCFQIDMKSNFGWEYTWASEYNEDDTKLLVSGVIDYEFGEGEIAIFNTGRASSDTKKTFGPRYQFLFKVTNYPYDMNGCWYNKNSFLCGTLSDNYQLEESCTIWICEIQKSGHKKSVLFNFNNPKNPLTIYNNHIHAFTRKKNLENLNIWEYSDGENSNEKDEKGLTLDLSQDEG